MAKESGIRLIANNKKAYHDYFIEDTYEAGIELVISVPMKRETYLIRTP